MPGVLGLWHPTYTSGIGQSILVAYSNEIKPGIEGNDRIIWTWDNHPCNQIMTALVIFILIRLHTSHGVQTLMNVQASTIFYWRLKLLLRGLLLPSNNTILIFPFVYYFYNSIWFCKMALYIFAHHVKSEILSAWGSNHVTYCGTDKVNFNHQQKSDELFKCKIRMHFWVRKAGYTQHPYQY